MEKNIKTFLITIGSYIAFVIICMVFNVVTKPNDSLELVASFLAATVGVGVYKQLQKEESKSKQKGNPMV